MKKDVAVKKEVEKHLEEKEQIQEGK